MAKGAKRKQYFILGICVVLGIAVAVLVFRDIPAPLSEHVIELDTANVLK